MGDTQRSSAQQKRCHIFETKKPLQLLETAFCREEEIRTLDTVTHILPFQGSSFNHSDTSLYRGYGVQR